MSVIPYIPEDWGEKSKNWVEDRVTSAKKAVDDKIKLCLKSYIGKTGRCDLVSLMIDMTEYKGDRPRRLAMRAKGKGKGGDANMG